MTEYFNRDLAQDLLESVEVSGTRDLLPGPGVGDDEVAESELALDVVADLLREGLGFLHDEAYVQLLGHLAHALLRRLHQDGHAAVVLADEVAEVHADVRHL